MIFSIRVGDKMTVTNLYFLVLQKCNELLLFCV